MAVTSHSKQILIEHLLCANTVPGTSVTLVNKTGKSVPYSLLEVMIRGNNKYMHIRVCSRCSCLQEGSPTQHIRWGNQSTVSWLPLRSWSLSKGNSNSDVVWCFAQQCWHQVATEPCFLGGSKRVALRFTTSRTKVMPSCLSVLFWCPSPVNHVCGGQIAGSRELPREAKLPLLYFPFPVHSFKTTPPPEKPISDFFFLPILQKKRKVLILFIRYFHWIKVIKSQNKVYPDI